jgi:hypothetical protein
MVYGVAGCAPRAGGEPAESPPAPPPASIAPSPTDAIGPNPQAACIDGAAFVADLTLPDGTQVEPGQSVTKQWSVRNNGSCDWGPGYRLVPILPNPLASDQEVALFPARAGAQAVWQVALVIPETSGELIGRWVAQNPAGVTFGEEVYVVLEVVPPTAQSSPQTSPTP